MAEAIADVILVQNARRGDQDSFVRLYGRYRDEIFNFVYRLSASTGLAESVTHDCFFRLLKDSAPRLTDGPESIRLYLYSTAHDLARQYALDSDQQSIRIDLEGHEAATLVPKAIASLPLFEREILILTEYHGLKLNEIASVVKTDRHKIAEGLATARKRLRTILANYLSKDS